MKAGLAGKTDKLYLQGTISYKISDVMPVIYPQEHIADICDDMLKLAWKSFIKDGKAPFAVFYVHLTHMTEGQKMDFVKFQGHAVGG